MNEQSFRILEYAELLALVRRGTQTPMGHARIDALHPFEDANDLRRALALVAECVVLRQRGVQWSLSELADPAESLSRLHIAGAALESQEILELARLCEHALAARVAIQSERDSAPLLWNFLTALPATLHSVVARIRNKILPNGEFDDRASPELARVRHEIARLRSNITRTLENVMRRSEEAIQDELVTVRNDRFVIPVRSDHRGRVQGVAHGFSSSGATAFVEPLETIEANNELQNLRELELQEIARILFALTEELRAQLPSLEIAADAIAELDFVSAKYAFYEKFNCVVPAIESSDLELMEARHPLLEENLRTTNGQVVPVSFALNDERSTMVISGANAGGKTVVLKTAGLLSLMALSGLPVPASSARVPFYKSVLADIGDHQSLAANLSTFTSHVANIARMIESCEAPALVLLDEVGTGTDPEEGSALGVAVVDHFRRVCEAHVMATTHYAGLKMYATNDDSVINASVEFDEKTLRPTYRLMIGLAGSSSGLEIARRFGIPAAVINSASEQVNESSRSAVEYLQRIKRDAELAAELRQALEDERAAVAEKYSALDQQAERREQERQAAFAAEFQKAIKNFEEYSRQLLATVEDRAERLKLERESQKRMAELKREAQRAAAAGQSTVRANTTADKIKVVREGVVQDRKTTEAPSTSVTSEGRGYVLAEPRPLAVGDRVRLRTFGTVGIVDGIKGENAELRVKSVRMREKLSNLELVEPAPVETTRGSRLAPSRSTEIKLSPEHETSTARSELKVIGQTTDEAVDAVDKFLDEAFINGVNQLRIVHGHGTGALRKAIAGLLKTHPHVETFAAAPQDQGGSGATLVDLKQ